MDGTLTELYSGYSRYDVYNLGLYVCADLIGCRWASEQKTFLQ